MLSTVTEGRLTSKEAIELLLASNFDADSKECILTLLKVIDNIRSKPLDPKVRTLRKSNAIVRRKILDRKGGLEILLSIGFTYVYPTLAPRIGIPSVATAEENDDQNAVRNPEEAEAIELKVGTEDIKALDSLRNSLGEALVRELGTAPEDVPPPKTAPKTTTATMSTSGTEPPQSFDPFRSHAYNGVAAKNPTSFRPDGSPHGGKSDTQVRLEELEGKRKRMEREMQGGGKGSIDRAIVARRKGDATNAAVVVGDSAESSGAGARRGGDGSLLANHLRRKTEERRKREEGGFTTRAMRDLAALEKSKVYANARLRVSFPDGTSLSASFLPSETVRTVIATITCCLVTEGGGEGGQDGGGMFELYVAPPRRKLEDNRTLVDEGLVPAAVVFVSWKMGGLGDGWEAGSYLRPELFEAGKVSDSKGKGGNSGVEAFPQSKALINNEKDQGSSGMKGGKNGIGLGKAKSSSSTKEDEMIARMMGKGKGIGGRKLGTGGKRTDSKSSGDPKGKLKWFKR